MTNLVKEGKSIIMVSSELPELIGMCDRIYVMAAVRSPENLSGRNSRKRRSCATR